MLVYGESDGSTIEPTDPPRYVRTTPVNPVPPGEAYAGLRALWVEYVCGDRGAFARYRAREERGR